MTMTTQTTARATRLGPTARSDLHVYASDGEATLYDRRTGSLFFLNQTAHRIWRLCDGSHDVIAIARAIGDGRTVTVEQAAAHVEATLRWLYANGLLVSPTRHGADASRRPDNEPKDEKRWNGRATRRNSTETAAAQ